MGYGNVILGKSSAKHLFGKSGTLLVHKKKHKIEQKESKNEEESCREYSSIEKRRKKLWQKKHWK
jgi:hypothetical protein